MGLRLTIISCTKLYHQWKAGVRSFYSCCKRSFSGSYHVAPFSSSIGDRFHVFRVSLCCGLDCQQDTTWTQRCRGRIVSHTVSILSIYAQVHYIHPCIMSSWCWNFIMGHKVSNSPRHLAMHNIIDMYCNPCVVHSAMHNAVDIILSLHCCRC